MEDSNSVFQSDLLYVVDITVVIFELG